MELICTEACTLTFSLWDALDLGYEQWGQVVVMVLGIWAVGFLVRQIMRAMDDEGPAS